MRLVARALSLLYETLWIRPENEIIIALLIITLVGNWNIWDETRRTHENCKILSALGLRIAKLV